MNICTVPFGFLFIYILKSNYLFYEKVFGAIALFFALCKGFCEDDSHLCFFAMSICGPYFLIYHQNYFLNVNSQMPA